MSKLYKAAEIGDLEEVIRLVKSGANMNYETITGHTPLIVAIIEGHIDVVRYLIQYGSSVNGTDENLYNPLHVAIEHRDEEIVNILINAGADVNRLAVPNHRQYVIFKMSDKNCTPLHSAITYGLDNIVITLIKEGANVHVITPNTKHTLLHCAVDNCRISTIGILINAGVDIDQVDSEGRTPLHLAVINADSDRSGRPDLSAIRELMKYNPNDTIRDNKGKLARKYIKHYYILCTLMDNYDYYPDDIKEPEGL